ncbi:family 43 glycosylhydrolase [Negadavirga shengliensis]|uniref:Family 43 glycosylhydrolase n=1 Tax=Negadavirga shengliensis TaxID=1389218 RepID=A0ABV9T0C0_9BACT
MKTAFDITGSKKMTSIPTGIMAIFYLLFCMCFTAGLNGCSDPNTLNESEEKTFVNPIADGADPWVIEKDGYYYYCGSKGNGIYISRSKKLTEHGERITVWQTPDEGWNQSNVWAPELHYFNGRWYIYYAAGEKPGSPFISQRSGVLESTSEDPFGPYEDKGMLYTGDNIKDPASVKWAIDLTPFGWNGKLYAIWSGWEENRDTDRTPQHLYIAAMSDPKTISSNRVKISSPEASWETGGELDLNEGPQILKNQDQVFIIYSTRESWLKEYRLGQLALNDPGADPMQPESWKKSGPVFQGTDQVYGVGHCSFAKSPDGKEDWLLYHTKKSTEPGWDRDIRLQPFGWKPDGSPDFGTPVPAGKPLKVPSGEENLPEESQDHG